MTDQLHLYRCFRPCGIVGYGATQAEADAMADRIEAAQRERAAKTRAAKPAPVRRYRFNFEAQRIEAMEDVK